MGYEKLIQLLFKIFEDNVYCEDNTLRIKNKLKYDIHNMLEMLEPQAMKVLYDKLEYMEEDSE